jgi:hypothetical protein
MTAGKSRFPRISVSANTDLPPNAGGRVPTGLAFDANNRLYVCFRDQNLRRSSKLTHLRSSKVIQALDSDRGSIRIRDQSLKAP